MAKEQQQPTASLQPPWRLQSTDSGYVWVVERVEPDGTLRVHGETEPKETRTINPAEQKALFRTLVIIPLDMCQELSVLGKGKTVGLKVLGILTDKGVVVENVDLLR